MGTGRKFNYGRGRSPGHPSRRNRATRNQVDKNGYAVEQTTGYGSMAKDAAKTYGKIRNTKPVKKIRKSLWERTKHKLSKVKNSKFVQGAANGIKTTGKYIKKNAKHVARATKVATKYGGKVVGAAANVVAPVVGFGKGVLKPAGSFSERLTNGIVGGAKKLDNAGAGFAGAYTGGKLGAAAGATVGTAFGGVGAVPGAAVGTFTGSVVGGIAASNKYDGSKADKAYDRMIESKRGAIHKRVEKNVNRVKNAGRSVKKFFTGNGKRSKGSRGRNSRTYSRSPGHPSQKKIYSRSPGHPSQMKSQNTRGKLRKSNRNRNSRTYSRSPGHPSQKKIYSRSPGHPSQMKSQNTRGK